MIITGLPLLQVPLAFFPVPQVVCALPGAQLELPKPFPVAQLEATLAPDEQIPAKPPEPAWHLAVPPEPV